MQRRLAVLAFTAIVVAAGCEAQPQPTASTSTVTSAISTPAPSSQACDLLPADAVAEAAGVSSATATPSSQGTFVSCQYALVTVDGAGATLYLDVSADRGPQVYSAAIAGGGFAAVTGVGEQAAYSAKTGRFITQAGPVFVGVTLPTSLTGSSLATAADTKTVGETLVTKVLLALD